jgi:hypothetical protein
VTKKKKFYDFGPRLAGKNDRAEKFYRKALELRPEVSTHLNMSQCFRTYHWLVHNFTNIPGC